MNRNLSFAIIVTGSVIFSGCGRSGQNKQQGPPAEQAVPVSVYKVQKEPVSGMDTYPGTVVALNEVELRAEVSGYITGIFVRDGQAVSKGQRLYEIDRSRYQAAYRSAQAQVQIARANLEKVKKDFERYNRLAQQDAIAKQRVDYAQTDLQTAQSQLSAAQAALTTAATDLRHSVIVAPASGKVGIAAVKMGSLVTAGSTLLNTISSPNPIGVDININERDIPYFLKLQHAGAAAFTITLSDQTKYNANGKIIAIDRSVDPQTGTIKVRASFPNSSGRLTAGMNCTVEVPSKQSGEQIVIPFKAVSEQLGEFGVFVVGDSNKVFQRPVKLGIKVADKIVVTEGLKEGETIVSEGTQNLKEGAKIQVADPAAANAPAGPGQK